MAHDSPLTERSDPPDLVRACMAMTAAGVAVAVLPYGLMAALFAGMTWWQGDGPVLGGDDVTGMARVLLLCTLAAGVAAIVVGIRAAWQARLGLRAHGYVGAWLALAAATIAVWCWPPFQFVTSLWMLVGATLATRPLRWALAASGPLDGDDIRSLRRQVFGLTLVITVLSHVAAWTAVIGLAPPVPDGEFARVDAIRRGEPVERRPWEQDGPFDVDVVLGGAIAAGRSVGGDMSPFVFAVGPWPTLAQWWIAPAAEGPTWRESWAIAAVAVVLSLVFWIPASTLWTLAGTPRRPTPAPPTAGPDGA